MSETRRCQTRTVSEAWAVSGTRTVSEARGQCQARAVSGTRGGGSARPRKRAGAEGGAPQGRRYAILRLGKDVPPFLLITSKYVF
ncbi:MAG: hypothetical protein LBK25_03090 [Treponema sp.]|nr:hypothetical protein [Treponema sp.]